MKETDGWVKIKKYTDDEGKPICGECCFAPVGCKERRKPIACAFSTWAERPGPSCPIWHGESKSEWLDIETAPKDGTEVDLFAPALGRRPDCAFAKGEWVEWGQDSFDTLERVSLKPYTPTHWMPLPAPPQENKP